MWTLLFVIAVLTPQALAASVLPCPQGCGCLYVDDKLQLSCSTFDPLKELRWNQLEVLDTLNVQNSFVTDVDFKVNERALKNLKTLDLSNNEISRVPDISYLTGLRNLNLGGNKIKFISAGSLPETLTNLDVSYNLIKELPKDFSTLKHLQQLNISGNPLLCSCSLLYAREDLKKNQVVLHEPVVCQYPDEYRGKSWYSDGICPALQASTDIWDEIQNDEGSGSGGGEIVPETSVDVFQEDIEKEFIPEVDHENTAKEDDTEGSGGNIIENYDIHKPKACYINCSTPPPLDNRNDNETSNIGLFDSIKTIFDDLSGKSGDTTTSPPEEPAKKSNIAEIAAAVTPKPIETKSLEEEKAKPEAESKQSNSVHILLFLLGAFLAILILYATTSSLKKRNRRRRNRSDKKEHDGMTELALISSKPEKNGSNNVLERVPLMNGQNGRTIEEPDRKDGNIYELAPTNGGEDIEFRKNKEALLTPETKRVTIRASEIPGSVPRTPLLVERHVSSDGNIITTPSTDQRI